MTLHTWGVEKIEREMLLFLHFVSYTTSVIQVEKLNYLVCWYLEVSDLIHSAIIRGPAF